MRAAGGKVVMFDVDGVLADFIVGFTEIGHRLLPDKIQPRTTLETERWQAGPHDDVVWKEIVRSPDFWYRLPSLVTEEEACAIQDIAEDYDTYFVTARVGFLPKQQTERWIEDYLAVKSPTVIISSKKGEIAECLRATHAIDDKAGNAIAISWMSRGTKSYVLDRRHNRFDHGVVGGSVTRVHSVAEFVAAVRE